MKEREVKIIICTGFKGVGKSYETFFHLLMRYQNGELNGGIPRKVLIIDVNDEYGKMKPHPSDKFGIELTGGQTYEVKSIEPKDIKAFSNQKKIEIRRLRPFHYRDFYDDKNKLVRRAGEMMGEKEILKLVTKALNEFRNGCILVEDLASSVGAHVPNKIFSEITRNRHRGNDIVTHIQSINSILPKFWDNADVLRFHKQSQDVDRSEQKIPGLYPIFKIASLIIDRHYKDLNDKRFFVYIDILRQKISGLFSDEELTKAIHEYIALKSNILRPLIYLKDESGRSVYNYTQARDKKANELFYLYNGNIKQKKIKED